MGQQEPFEPLAGENTMTQPLTKEARETIAKSRRFDALRHKYCRITESLESGIGRLEQERDLATAKLATAKVCEKCKGTGCRFGYWHDKPCHTCLHCVNGVQFSDERARELLERLARAEEDSDDFEWLIKSGAHVVFVKDHCWLHWPYGPKDEEGSPRNQNGKFDTPREAIRAARAKEGKE